MKKNNLLTLAMALILAGSICLLFSGCGNNQAQSQAYAATDVTMVVTEESISELYNYADLQTADLRGSPCYAAILRFMEDRPEVQVTYTVDFGSSSFENHVSEVELTAGNVNYDILMENLQYLPNVTSLSLPLTNLTPEQLLSLRESYANIAVSWSVMLQNQEIAWDTTELTLPDADGQAVLEALAYLPCLKDVTFAGTAPDNAVIGEMRASYPEITFHWIFYLLGVPVSSDSTEIDLSGIAMESVEALEDSLNYFNALEKVVMCDTGLSSEEIDALWKRHEDIRFVWNVQIGRFQVRTDVTALMPNQYGYYGTDSYGRLRDKDCTEMKYLVDMVCLDFGHMAITDISFVAYMPNLEYLIIGDSCVTDLSPLASASKLKYLEAFYSGVKDISPLAECHALEDVNICHNNITDFSPLLELENLQHIWVAGHRFTDEMKAELEAAHPDAVIVYILVGSTGAGWRNIPNYYAQRDMLGAPYMAGG